MDNISYLVGGWATPLKHMKVRWDDDIPEIWKNKSHVPNHQPDMNWGFWFFMLYTVETCWHCEAADQDPSTRALGWETAAAVTAVARKVPMHRYRQLCAEGPKELHYPQGMAWHDSSVFQLKDGWHIRERDGKSVRFLSRIEEATSCGHFVKAKSTQKGSEN